MEKLKFALKCVKCPQGAGWGAGPPPPSRDIKSGTIGRRVPAAPNRWSAVHRLDVAPVYRLALEKESAGEKYHAVAEEGVPVRQIAEVIGRGLKLPVESLSAEAAASHFGGLAFAAAMDAPASSALTQQRPGWHPTEQPGFVADFERSSAFEA